ncbi:MAG: BA14K family protein [Pseudomonadota bacterium]
MKLVWRSILTALGAAMLLGASAAPAAADFRCVTAAFNRFDDRIAGTRAVAERRFERRACLVALDRCERRLNRLRFETGRRRAFARCEIVRTRFVGRARPPSGFACNIDACANRYRSFRASDCTFQPFEGPRRRCAL